MTGLPNRFVVVVAISFLLPFKPAHSDEPAEGTVELTQQFVDNITMLGIREDGTRYRLEQPRLLMKFHDPERGIKVIETQTGALWAWGAGRPIALTEIWNWAERGIWGHTFISTTPGFVTASVDGKIWEPEQPGLNFTELQSAPIPANAFMERTGQMRQLTKQFTGYEMVKREVVELSILPEPLYRYEEDGIDGALFMLAHNGNPEAILFLEAVTDPSRPSYWRYAWAKGTSSPVTVELNGDELLQIPGSANYIGSATKPFWVIFPSKPKVSSRETRAVLQPLAPQP